MLLNQSSLQTPTWGLNKENAPIHKRKVMNSISDLLSADKINRSRLQVHGINWSPDEKKFQRQMSPA
jgi:hypothetical protein